MILARPSVEALHRYVAPLEGRRGLLRLDFNENTLGPSPEVLQAIRSLQAEDYAVYPEYEGLLAQFAEHAGVATENVALFNGADAALRAFFDAFGEPGSVFVTTQPTFGYYQPCADLAGMKTVAVPYNHDFSFPEAALDSALAAGARLCVLCNPNNPTGTLVPAKQLLSLASRHPNTLFLVDEIYETYTGVSVLPQALATPNMVAIRSLSKSMGLAALRIGFACGPERLVERAHRVTGPYDVNAFGVTAARAALNNWRTTQQYVQQVRDAKLWTRAQLQALGLRHYGQGGNWLVTWPCSSMSGSSISGSSTPNRGASANDAPCGKDAPQVVAKLREKGILVRSLHGKPLMEGAFRLTIGTQPQMERFIMALRAILPA